MKRLKVLPLSLRGKKRYIKFEILNGEISHKKVYEKFKEMFLKLFGHFGFSLASPKFVLGKKNFVIIKCNHTFVPEVIVSMSLTIFGENKILRVLKISGTIKKLKN